MKQDNGTNNPRSSNRVAVGVDVGGTSVRLGLVTDAGNLLAGTVREFDPHCHADAATILDRFAGALAPVLDPMPAGIGIGFPGPFDYARGICMIRGLAKYEALYGMDVGKELRRRLALPAHVPIRFVNDATAFALGEALFGAARGQNRVIVLTFGTGCGSAFLVDGKVVTDGEGVPPNGWVYPLLHRGVPLDELLSRRGILNLWAEVRSERDENGTEPAERAGQGDAFDVVDLARLARSGDAMAREVFRRFGQTAGEALSPVVLAFRPAALVIGGKIAKSFDLFGPQLTEALAPCARPCRVLPAQDIENAALKGAASIVFGGQ